MNRLVIFDLDGTLIDSLPDISYNVNLALEKFGYKRCEYREVMANIGNGARRLIKDCMGANVTEDQVDECLEFYNQIYTNSGSPRTGLFDGVSDLLKKLKETGYKIAILTNKPQFTTDNVYQNYLKEFEFDMVVGQSDKIKCKPDKAGAEFIMKSLDVLPENCYFIGDGETDVLTALNARITPICVLWGYRNKAQLEKAGGKTFALSPKDIFSLLEF